MDIEVVRPDGLKAADAARWSELRQAIGLISPFFSPDWPRECARANGPDRRARVAVLREDGRPVGFLPARLSRFAAQPVGAPMCDYQGAAVEAGYRFDPRTVVRAFGVHRLDFDTQIASQLEMTPYMRGRAASHVVCLRDGYDAYVANRKAAGSNVLNDCARKRRKLAREVGEIRFTPASDIQADFDAMVAWKRERYAESRQTDIFKADWTRRLLHNLFSAPLGEIRGQLFTLRAGDKLLATHYALTDGRALHAWFIAHDEEAARYSPGMILIVEILQWAAAHGISEFDLGTGGYRFKHSLANMQRETAFGYVGSPSPATAVRAMAYGVRGVAEGLPLGRVSGWPGKAMRRLDIVRGLRGGWSYAR